MTWERCSLPSMSLSAPSCQAGVYARCRLKTMETGVELLALWVVRGPTSHGITLLTYYITSRNSCGTYSERA